MFWSFGALRDKVANVDLSTALRHGKRLRYEAWKPIAIDDQPNRRLGGGE
jgi:hypothetical protein